MAPHVRQVSCTLLAAATMLGCGVASLTASEQTSAGQEARLARRISTALEAMHLAEAAMDARHAVEQFPASALIQRRLAQVDLCLAIQRGNDLDQALMSAVWSEKLRRLGDVLSSMSDAEPDKEPVRAAKRREQREELRKAVSGPVVIRFQEQALVGLKQSDALAQQRSQALLDALAAVKEARRLGDADTELELTELWTETLPLFWRQETARLRGLGKERLLGLEKTLSPFDGIQPDAVLRAAAGLAKARPEDPTALAGAADIISVVAGTSRKPDPLGDRIRTILDRAYRQNAEVFEPSLNAAGMERARKLYTQIRDAQDPDVLAAPATVALQLYTQAYQKDIKGMLPFLRLRLYLLRAAFDPDAARPLLEDIRRHEPGNAVVPLEQARVAFLLENQPLEGIRHLQEATRRPSFSRSWLVAAPAPLRASLNLQKQLREWSGRAWPGYGKLFGTLDEMMYPRDAVVPGMTRAQWQLYGEIADRFDLAPVYLSMADRLCQAPDYADQATGIDRKSHILGLMASLARKRQEPILSERLLGQLAAHRRAFVGFPRTRGWLRFSPTGLDFVEYPSTSSDRFRSDGPYVMLNPDSDNFFGVF